MYMYTLTFILTSWENPANSLWLIWPGAPQAVVGHPIWRGKTTQAYPIWKLTSFNMIIMESWSFQNGCIYNWYLAPLIVTVKSPRFSGDHDGVILQEDGTYIAKCRPDGRWWILGHLRTIETTCKPYQSIFGGNIKKIWRIRGTYLGVNMLKNYQESMHSKY